MQETENTTLKTEENEKQLEKDSNNSTESPAGKEDSKTESDSEANTDDSAMEVDKDEGKNGAANGEAATDGEDVVMKDTSEVASDTHADEKKVDAATEVPEEPGTPEAPSEPSEPNESNQMGDSSESIKENNNNNNNGEAAAEPKEDEPASESAPAEETSSTPSPPPPVMRGTLSYNLESRKHLIRGMWNYENSTTFPPQRFELLRVLGPEENITELPKDGEFHGSFSLAYFHTTSKGKRKERSRTIPETGVNIKFTPVEGKPGEYTVDGKGTNQFGIFHVNGTASPSAMEGDPEMRIEFRKRYEPAPQADAAGAATDALARKPKGDGADDPLPPPSESFPTGVVCLRGNLFKEESRDIAGTEVTQRITGKWAAGLNFILADPENNRGLLCRFEYEHKSSAPTTGQPVSGRYSGWFDLKGDDGTKTRINERDVTLKFRKNDAGYHNIEGKGSNVFGKYTITGTLTTENVITIFRHFVPRKIKGNKAATSVLPTSAAQARRTTSFTAPAVEAKLKLDDVVVDGEPSDEPLDAVKPPDHPTYSAVSRGVLRVNGDGSHSCAGKWAVTREHFTNGQTSNFNFRLEPHHASEAMTASTERAFPLDCNMYKGSFQLKKQAGRSQTIVDQQVVMKFRMNKAGSYNVYGKGINAIGEFNLTGTLVMSGKTGGQVELYRMYPPERLVTPAAPKAASSSMPNGAARLPSQPAPMSLVRRESTRLTKLPSRLEDDDPSAQLSRVMEKCSQILRIVREKDVELGAFFSEPVDPVALGIPTYHQIIKEPMDLKTIHRRMEAGQIKTPNEFSRLCRLVFENAITFNVDPSHAVHQSARALLVQFNTKFRDVEHMLTTIRRNIETEKKKDKRAKREEPKSAKRQRLDELQAMSAENERLVSSFMAATPTSPGAAVTRAELGVMFQMFQHLQRGITQTLAAVAELSPGDENDAAASVDTAIAVFGGTTTAPAPAPKKKKAKRKAEVIEEETMMIDDSAPLTLDEQELLTETINDLPRESQDGVIQIIREAAPVGADEDEIELEIDLLDTKTQRKLLRHVQKFVKKAKAKKKQKTKKASPAPKQSPKAPPPRAEPAGESFFAFGGNGNSDSDSDDEPLKPSMNQNGGGKSFQAEASNDFTLGRGMDDLADDNEEEIGGGMAPSWTLNKPTASAEKKDGDDDDWGAAREEAAAGRIRDAERKAREEKIQAEAEQAKKDRLAEAVKRGEKLKEEREEEKEKEAKLKEQQEKEAEEARKAAREAARAQTQAVERTVDMDAQRDIMKEYEENFLDKEAGSASPSSDFGF